MDNPDHISEVIDLARRISDKLSPGDKVSFEQGGMTYTIRKPVENWVEVPISD